MKTKNAIIIVRDGITISIKKLSDKHMNNLQETIYSKIREECMGDNDED